MSAGGIKRVSISSLSPNSIDFFVVGIIIAKRPSKIFESKRDGAERGVWGFTLRDSAADYINVNVWGTVQFVEGLSKCFKVGDVVDVYNPKAVIRKVDDNFQPSVTSCLELVLNEGMAHITLHDQEDCLYFSRLLRLPTKPPNNFLNLADIKANGQLLIGQLVNMLVAVQRVSTPREIMTKFGRTSNVLELSVMDQSSYDFSLQIWDLDVIDQASHWKPRDTVLFISDVKINWSEFKKCIFALVGSRTVLTENPATKEAEALSSFASTAPVEKTAIIDALANTMPHPDSIVNIMSCRGVLVKAYDKENMENFTALVYATLHQFDLDGCNPVTSTKCLRCHKIVSEECSDPDCSSRILPSTSPKVECVYDLRITLKDHTGRLSSCRLTGGAATTVLQYTADEFNLLSIEEKVELKWKFLLKQVAARMVVFPAGSRTTPIISIVGIQRVTLQEYASKLPVY